MLRLMTLALVLVSGATFAAPVGDSGDRLGKLDCEPGYIAKADADGWSCALDNISDPNTPTLVLRDSAGQQVGTVAGFLGQASVLIDFPGLLGADRAVLFFAIGPDALLASQTYFDEPNCQGNVYVAGGFPTLIVPSGIMEDTDGVRSVYVGREGEEPSTVQILSQNVSGGVCQELGFDLDVVPADLLVPDLEAMFPPPYALQWE